MDRVSATGMSLCQESVSSGMTLRGPHLPVQPAIRLTRACPSEGPFYGKAYRALGTVKNIGNVALVDVRIVHDGASEQVPVLGPISLLPGESTEYVVDGIAPLESCEWVDSVSVSAIDRCDGAGVFDRVTTVCPLQSFPRLSISKACPTPSPQSGQPWMYGATVTNTGNVPLPDRVTASGETTSMADGSARGVRRFYRVRIAE